MASMSFPRSQPQSQPQLDSKSESDFESNPESKKKIKIPNSSSSISASFNITYILLITTGTITFIEAIRTTNPVVRHILNLETCISIIAGYFYSIFTTKVAEYEKSNAPINWQLLTTMRYVDWSITTPMMLLVLCVVLSTEIRLHVHLPVISTIIFLNYVMLYAGYLGETQELDRTTANVLGFIPFFAMFGIIYWKYVAPKYSLTNHILFYVFLVIWSLYGVVYFFDIETKNLALNVLDLIAKCLVGLGLWAYYVHIVQL